VKQETRLTLVLLLNLAMIAGLVVVGLSSHSLGVLAAGGDYIADSAAIGLGLFAIRVSHHPNGHPKATSVVALINSLFLLVVTLFVIFAALQRLTSHTPEIEALPVIVISAVATIVMVVGVLILRSVEDGDDLHMRSVILDTVADAVSSAAVAITGGIILVTRGFYWLDSVIALAIGLGIGYQALKLLRDVINALRQTPSHGVKGNNR
jgi:cobalt-zinc-cadmium efflux system protein